MAWEKRKNGKRYFYRARRDGERVVKEYLGRGSAAEAAAREHSQLQEKRQAAGRQHREVLTEVSSVFAALDEFDRACDSLVQTALFAAGYHVHRGQWRQRRNRS